MAEPARSRLAPRRPGSSGKMTAEICRSGGAPATSRCTFRHFASHHNAQRPGSARSNLKAVGRHELTSQRGRLREAGHTDDQTPAARQNAGQCKCAVFVQLGLRLRHEERSVDRRQRDLAILQRRVIVGIELHAALKLRAALERNLQRIGRRGPYFHRSLGGERAALTYAESEQKI